MKEVTYCVFPYDLYSKGILLERLCVPDKKIKQLHRKFEGKINLINVEYGGSYVIYNFPTSHEPFGVSHDIVTGWAKTHCPRAMVCNVMLFERELHYMIDESIFVSDTGMAVYLFKYDLKGGSPAELIKKIQSYPAYRQKSETEWFIKSDKTNNEILMELSKYAKSGNNTIGMGAVTSIACVKQYEIEGYGLEDF